VPSPKKFSLIAIKVQSCSLARAFRRALCAQPEQSQGRMDGQDWRAWGDAVWYARRLPCKQCPGAWENKPVTGDRTVARGVQETRPAAGGAWETGPAAGGADRIRWAERCLACCACGKPEVSRVQPCRAWSSGEQKLGSSGGPPSIGQGWGRGGLHSEHRRGRNFEAEGAQVLEGSDLPAAAR
jgi:hypothetical protein